MTRTLSIVIPCYNEAKTVSEILSRVKTASTPGWEKEIVVVDDASTDGTRDILAWESGITLLLQEKNGGKGSAVRAGLAAATGEYVLIQDADLEYDPRDIVTMLKAIEEQVEVVFGSRNLRPTKRGGLIARSGVWFLTRLINLLHGQRLTDAWTCYKLFPRAAAGDFRAGRFESELLFIASLARRGYRFTEVAISYTPRDVSVGKKIRYRDGMWAIIVLIVDKLAHL